MSAPPSAVKGYYLPQPSPWPITGACALLLSALGAATWVNRGSAGPYILAAGMALLVYMLFGWFGTVIRESEAGLYNKQVDVSYRWAMGWFIFSETMFFAAFFGALFYMRWHAVPDLASGDTAELWPGFKGSWPASGPSSRASRYGDPDWTASPCRSPTPASTPPFRRGRCARSRTSPPR